MARRLVAEATAVAKLDISDVERGVLRIKELLQGLANKVTIKVGLDQTGIKTDLTKIRTEASAKPVKVGTDLDVGAAETKIRKFTGEKRAADVDLTVDGATARLEALKAQLAATDLAADANIRANLDFDRAAAAGQLAAVTKGIGPAKVKTDLDFDAAAAAVGAEGAKATLSKAIGNVNVGLVVPTGTAATSKLIADLQEQKLKLASFAEANEVNVPLNVVDTKLLSDLAKTRAEVNAALHDPFRVRLEPTPFPVLAAELRADLAGLMALGSTTPVEIKMRPSIPVGDIDRNRGFIATAMSRSPIEVPAELDQRSVGRVRATLRAIGRGTKVLFEANVEGLQGVATAIASIGGRKEVRTKIVADGTEAVAEARRVQANLLAIGDAKIRVQVESAAALSKIYEIGGAAEDVARAKHKLSFDTSAARRAVKEFEVYTKSLKDVEAKINLDSARAIAATLTFRERAAKILGAGIRADVDLKSVGAEIKAQTLGERLKLLLGKVTIDTDIDGSKATTEAVAIKSRIRAIFHLGGGVDIPVGVDVKGGEVAAAKAGRGIISTLTKILSGAGKGAIDIGLGSTTQGTNAAIGAIGSSGGSGPLGLVTTAAGLATAALVLNAAAWTAVGVAAAGAAIPITKFAIDAAEELQGPLIALSRQLQGTGTDFADFGAKVAGQAINTPFQLATTLRANQRLIGQGVKPEEALNLNRIIADLVAASGGTDAQFNQVNLAVAKLKGRGVLNQRLITSLVTNAPGSFSQGAFLEQIAQMKGMIDASSTLADKERARAEVTKMITNREIDANTALAAFKATAEATPGVIGAADAQVRTLAGGLSNLKDALQVGSLIGFQDFFKTAGQALPDISQSLGAALAKIGPAVNDAFKEILPTIRPLIAGISTLIATSVRAVGPVVAEVAKIASVVSVGIGPAITRIFGAIGRVLKDNRGQIAETLITLANVGATTVEVISRIVNGVFLLANTFGNLGDLFRSTFDILLGGILGTVSKIVDAIPGLSTLLRESGFVDIEKVKTFAGERTASGQQRLGGALTDIFKRREDANSSFDDLFGRLPEKFDVIKNLGPALETLKEQFGNTFGPAGISALTSETAGVMEGDFESAEEAAASLGGAVEAAAAKIAEGLQIAGNAGSAFGDALGKAFDTESGKIDVGKLKENFRKNAEDIRAQALIVAAATASGLTSVAAQLKDLNPAEAVELWRSTTKDELTAFELEMRSTDIFIGKFAVTSDDIALRLQAEQALTSIGSEIQQLANAKVPIPVAGFLGVKQSDVDKAKIENAAAYQQIVDFINGLSATSPIKPGSWLDGWFGDTPKAVNATVNFDTSATSPGLKRLLLDDKGSATTAVTTKVDFDTSATSPGLKRLLLDDKGGVTTVKANVEIGVTSPFKPGSALAGWFDGKPQVATRAAATTIPVSADTSAADRAIAGVSTKAAQSRAAVIIGADINPAVTSIQNLVRIAAAMSVAVPVTIQLITNGLFELIAGIRRELSKPVNIPVTVNGQPAATIVPRTQPVRIPERWTGGHTPRGFAKVGEKGPEIIHFPRPGEVLNNATSERLMAAVSANAAYTSTSTSTSTSNVAVDTTELGRIIAEHLGTPVAVHPPYGDPEAIASAVIARYAERGRSRVPA